MGGTVPQRVLAGDNLSSRLTVPSGKVDFDGGPTLDVTPVLCPSRYTMQLQLTAEAADLIRRKGGTAALDFISAVG